MAYSVMFSAFGRAHLFPLLSAFALAIARALEGFGRLRLPRIYFSGARRERRRRSRRAPEKNRLEGPCPSKPPCERVPA
jgi:hypothetical protein